jgi:hypothetical protein
VIGDLNKIIFMDANLQMSTFKEKHVNENTTPIQLSNKVRLQSLEISKTLLALKHQRGTFLNCYHQLPREAGLHLQFIQCLSLVHTGTASTTWATVSLPRSQSMTLVRVRLNLHCTGDRFSSISHPRYLLVTQASKHSNLSSGRQTY